MGETIRQDGGYLKAYYEFRESVDFAQGGFLPDLDNLVWYLLVGVPPVPADGDDSEEGKLAALDQRLNILKAVFVELNRNMPDPFLDQGLGIYDTAGKNAREMIREKCLK
ncbi:MAG: hypothetical protein K9N21_12700 [Deltaproteobacteria bacterium]|nr:hypothetical protein [Deltaproteobacteria bacterium]